MRMKELIIISLIFVAEGAFGLLVGAGIYGVYEGGRYVIKEMQSKPKKEKLSPAQKERLNDALEDGRIG